MNGSLLNEWSKEKQLEVGFIAVFSVVILIGFYSVISMNGVVLGNDPAVHLEKANIYLNTHYISLANLGWTPPLYQIFLAVTIALTGASSIGEYIFLLRALTAVIDWMLFMSVYLVGSRFFNKKVGATAAVVLLMCFPVFEANQFGGYTTVLALGFTLLVLLYTPLAVDKMGYLVVAFVAAFGLVLSHQLATFLAAFILPPVLLFMLIKSKGKNLKVVLAIALGGGIAFFLYYFQAVFAYLDLVIEYIFFAVKTYAYQIPSAGLTALMTNFGFVFFVAMAGVGVSFYVLKREKKLLYWLILALALFVPFFFAESYLIGFYMPFSWFIYYMTPPIAILAAATLVFTWDKASAYYLKNRAVFRKVWVKAVAVALVVGLCAVVVVRADTVYGRITEAGVYYSTTDLKALDAGVWLKENYPEKTNVVCTEVPGFWLQAFSGKNVTAQTDPTVQRMEIAEAVLTLSYELEHSQTMVKAYQAKGDTLDEAYVSLDDIWMRVSSTVGSGNSIFYTVNGVEHEVRLNELNKEIIFQADPAPKSMMFVLSNDEIALTKTITFENNSYPFNVEWTLTPLKNQVNNATLYLTTNFDLQFHFDKAEIPGLLDWVNPWDAPVHLRTSDENWTVMSFAGGNVVENRFLGLYDTDDKIGYAFKFNELPLWGNIGALGNRQIDAVRLVYDLGDVSVGAVASRSYTVLTLSQSSYPILQPDSLRGLFEEKIDVFHVTSRDFNDYIKDHNIGFIVYDKNELDPQMVHNKILQLVYSNDRYVVFRIVQT